MLHLDWVWFCHVLCELSQQLSRWTHTRINLLCILHCSIKGIKGAEGDAEVTIQNETYLCTQRNLKSRAMCSTQSNWYSDVQLTPEPEDQALLYCCSAYH